MFGFLICFTLQIDDGTGTAVSFAESKTETPITIFLLSALTISTLPDSDMSFVTLSGKYFQEYLSNWSCKFYIFWGTTTILDADTGAVSAHFEDVDSTQSLTVSLKESTINLNGTRYFDCFGRNNLYFVR